MKKIKKMLSIIALSYLMQIAVVYATIKVGNPVYRPPFVFNQEEGFDIDLMKLLCQKINEDCEFHSMEFNNLYIALNEGKLDLAIGGITISQARKATYIFSLPYMESHGQFIALKNSGLKSISDLKGKKIGAVRGSDYEDFLVNHYGLEFEIALYEGPVALIASLNQGDTDAIFSDSISMKYWRQTSDGVLVNVGDPMTVGGGFAIMALPQKADLIESINQQLLKIEKDGNYIKLYNSYLTD
ncbi:transporter substrate-binding domain-containing protein [Legionella donaldsonii]|nr:transporter substrate-binding domain-containing protein [Legionella donaldsonii]